MAKDELGFTVDYRDHREAHLVSRRDNEVMLGGILAGFLASLSMLIVLCFAGALRGDGAFYPLKLIATTAYGPDVALAPLTVNVAVTGFMLHFLIGIGFGIIFGFFADAARPSTLWGLVGAGVCYGLAVFLGMFLYVVPMLAPMLGEQQWLTSALAHVAFGATLALFWPITEHIHKANEDVAPRPLPTI